jgi:hypothetical protein
LSTELIITVQNMSNFIPLSKRFGFQIGVAQIQMPSTNTENVNTIRNYQNENSYRNSTPQNLMISHLVDIDKISRVRPDRIIPNRLAQRKEQLKKVVRPPHHKQLH